MNTARTIISGTNGKRIPVTVDINVKPLTHSVIENGFLVKNKPVKRVNGEPVMNDEWIYVTVPNYGRISINVNRHNFCRKIYLQQVKIVESIPGKKISPRLKKFIETVADTIVFEKDGVSYKVYLKETKKGFDLDYVWPYWATCGTGGISTPWDSCIKKYGSHPGWDYHFENGVRGEHKLNVNLKEKFNFDYEG